MLSNTWNKIKSWAESFWKSAWTKIWAQAQLVGAALVAGAGYIGGIVNDPHVQSAVSAVAMPTWATISLAVIGAVTLLSMPSKED